MMTIREQIEHIIVHRNESLEDAVDEIVELLARKKIEKIDKKLRRLKRKYEKPKPWKENLLETEYGQGKYAGWYEALYWARVNLK